VPTHIWCVAKKSQLEWTRWRWYQQTPNRAGVEIRMWFSIHSRVHENWLINGDKRTDFSNHYTCTNTSAVICTALLQSVTNSKDVTGTTLHTDKNNFNNFSCMISSFLFTVTKNLWQRLEYNLYGFFLLPRTISNNPSGTISTVLITTTTLLQRPGMT
jgi:hypothetical protein